MSDLVKRAAAFAEKAHAGQVRRYTSVPYTSHTTAVAALLAVYGIPEHVIAAAHLHDAIEDTAVTLSEVDAQFGPLVAILVDEVTDASKPTDGNRAARKAIDRAKIAAASAEGQTIKCADLIDNSLSIVAHDPGFARTYLAEKEATLKLLTRADPSLLALAWETLREAQESMVQQTLKPPDYG